MPSCCFSKTLGNGLETRKGQALSRGFKCPLTQAGIALLRKAVFFSTFVFLLKCYPKKLQEGIKYNTSFPPPTLKNELFFRLLNKYD